MSEELKCTRLIRKMDGTTQQGTPIYHHERCGLPAAECEIGGLLGKAKAVLCQKHRLAADREAFISSNGYKMGRIDKQAKEKGYKQSRLPEAGLQ